MRKLLYTLCFCALGLIALGCRSIKARMEADGSWEASYYSYGLFTTLGALQVSVGTNGVASLYLDDLSTDVSTNHVLIVDSSGRVVAEIAGEIIKKVVIP